MDSLGNPFTAWLAHSTNFLLHSEYSSRGQLISKMSFSWQSRACKQITGHLHSLRHMKCLGFPNFRFFRHGKHQNKSCPSPQMIQYCIYSKERTERVLFPKSLKFISGFEIEIVWFLFQALCRKFLSFSPRPYSPDSLETHRMVSGACVITKSSIY